MKKDPFVVDRITFPKTKLVDERGEYHETFSVREALKTSKEYGLNLVCFDLPRDRNKLPLCKIIDFGKFKYRQDKKTKKMRNDQKSHSKEIRLTPVIDPHDVEHKMNQTIELLQEGDDVAVSMVFRGRHKKLRDVGEKRLEEIKEQFDLKELSRKSSINSITIQVKVNDTKDKDKK